jgi:transposase
MFCGIDVSKNKSNVCILNKDKTVVAEFEINHDKEGFQKLESYITQDTVIGMETTANYCKTIYSFLKQKHRVYYVDNVQMKNYARLHSLHIKNDKIDAKLIAKFLMEDEINKISPVKMNELKDLSRLYQKIVRQRATMKLMIKDQINILFPELEKHLFLREAKRLPQLLTKYPSANLISEASLEEIRDGLNQNPELNLSSIKYAKKIQDLAKTSVGIKDYPTTCFQYTVKMMLYMQNLSEEIIEKMKTCLYKTPYYPLLDEFGYSDISLATIVGEVGDIRRFPSHKHFVSYCGLGVSEKTSGSSIRKKSFITKKGNSVLRFRFYMSALVHLKNKTKYADFFYRLRDEKGKHAKKAMVATARKLAIKAYYDLLKCHNKQEAKNAS